jgi:hypothetical protein
MVMRISMNIGMAPFEHRTRKSSAFFNTYTPIIATHCPLILGK